MFKAGLIGTAADHPVSIDAVHWLLGQLAGTTAGGAEEGRFAVLANSQRRQHLVEKAFELVAQRQVRFHDLRHSSATIALAAGVDLKFVSERLGHTTIAEYSRPLPASGSNHARSGGTKDQRRFPTWRKICGKTGVKAVDDNATH
jgi:integrase